MSNGPWTSLGRKKLNLGGGGGGGGGPKMEYVLVGALALIIVGALTMTLWQFFGDGTTGPDGPPVVKFKCEKCGHEWEKDMSQMSPNSPEFGPMGPMGPGGFGPLDCPSCGAKGSCWQMVECPECKKWYISEVMKFQAQQLQSGQPPMTGQNQPRDVCPHCGTDRVEWYLKRARERRKK